jgi:hypothetical protein
MFPFYDEGRKTPTLFSPLERANSTQWLGPVIEVNFSKGPNKVGVSLSSHEDLKGSGFQTSCFKLFRTPDDWQSKQRFYQDKANAEQYCHFSLKGN